jgi:hypothetical protein
VDVDTMAMRGKMSGVSPSPPPPHRLIVLPWIRRPAQRLILPNWLAITLGSLIISWRPLDPVELAHELAHVEQWQRHGLRFAWLYWRASQRAQAAGGDRYHDNLFEVEARAAADVVAAAGPVTPA